MEAISVEDWSLKARHTCVTFTVNELIERGETLQSNKNECSSLSNIQAKN